MDTVMDTERALYSLHCYPDLPITFSAVLREIDAVSLDV
jgi:hypothetical protein